MAKVKFSAMLADVSGKWNGSVFARNRGGSYVRTKTTPTNPQTAAQAKVRNRFGMFSQAWRTLTEAQRKAWNSVTDQWQKTDVFGDLRSPSGNALFVRLNANIAKVGGSQIDTPPMPAGVGGANTVEFDTLEDDGTMKIDATFENIEAGQKILVEATPGMSPGISNAKNKFRQIAVLDHNAVFPSDISAHYEEKFGELVEGEKVFVRISVVSSTSGEQSPKLLNSALVAGA